MLLSQAGLPAGAIRMLTLLLVLIVSPVIVFTSAQSPEECRITKDAPLTVPDDRMRASSERGTCQARAARLNDDSGCGAWCPAAVVSSTSYEWLELDLGRLSNISFIEVQGRFAEGKGGEFTRAFRLQYDRGDGRGLVWYVDPVANSGSRPRPDYTVLNGNTNAYSSDFHRMPWLIARRIRFVLHSTSATGESMCLRVRLSGCYMDGVVAYNVTPAPQQQPWDQLPVSDTRFDGVVVPPNVSTVGGGRGALLGGLGLLTDGVLAVNFQVAAGAGIKRGGIGWLGWRQFSAADNVVLTFEFEEPRNFTKIHVHTNNQHQHEVRMFGRAIVSFSAGGSAYSDPEVFITQPDNLSEHPRMVELALPAGRVGRFVKVQLFFSARWIMISEILFDSTAVSPNHAAGIDEEPAELVVDFQTLSGEPGVTVPSNLQPDQGTASGLLMDTQTIGIIAGVSAGGVMLIICIVIVSVMCCRHRAEKHGANSGHYADPQFVLQSGFKPERGTLPAHPTAPGAAAYPNVSIKDGTYEEPWGRSLPHAPPGGGGMTGRGRPLPVGSLPNGYASDGAGSISEYAVIPDPGPNALLLPPPIHTAPGRPPVGLHRPAYPGLTGGRGVVVGCASIQGASGNSLFGMPTRELMPAFEDYPIVELPLGKLHFIEKLGEGQFGEVHLAEIDPALAAASGDGRSQLLALDEGIDGVGCHSPPLLVACKLLKSDASEAARKDFQREIKILSRLRDPNIVRVLGVSRPEVAGVEQPLCVIVEYMQFGDLHQFLRQHSPLEGVAGCGIGGGVGSTMLLHSLTRDSGCGRDAPSSGSAPKGTLSRGSLVYMASQVASGMKYLESLNMVHRDLAARNVLVGPLYSVKISDFGMSRRLYSSDYYRIEGRVVLPIRWMAWESILLGRFTTRSDVWSFGVLLWELFTFAVEPPYRYWSDEQVIDNCVLFRNASGDAAVLERPDYCPREVYDLMLSCWNADDFSRPSFKDIHLFLVHKNAGYDPRHDQAADVSAAAAAGPGQQGVMAFRRRGSNSRTLDDDVFVPAAGC